MVLVPLSTLGNWMNEFDRFCPSIRTIRLHGTKEEREVILKKLRRGSKQEWDVLITTYEMAMIEKGTLNRVKWEYEKEAGMRARYLVMDEAHRVKNENSKLSLILRQFSFENRLLLTGTPLQVRLDEMIEIRRTYTSYGHC